MLTGAALTVAGLVLLALAADRFVDAAVRLAWSLGVSVVLVGALLVGLGTSLPEVLVSSLAAARGELDVGIGNVVGSNISNVTLVLGTAVVLSPIVRQRQIVKREGILMLGAVTLLAFFLFDLELERWEALILLLAMVPAGALLVRWSEPADPDRPQPREARWRLLLFAVVAMGVTVLGAELLLRGALRVAAELEVTSAVVGLTLVAIGTSLPELAASVAAARRRQNDIVVGNVLGSNLFNSLVVTGIAGLVGPGFIDSEFRPALVYMVAVAFGAGALTLVGKDRLGYAEGAVLLVAFVAFLVLLA